MYRKEITDSVLKSWVTDYLKGESIKQLSRESGYGEELITTRLKAIGIKLRTHKESLTLRSIPVNPLKIILSESKLQELIADYEKGFSVNKLSKNHGFSRTVVKRILIENGIETRGRSDAERLKWRELKKDVKKVAKQCGGAWIASSGRKPSEAELTLRAKSRYKNQSQIHKGECSVAAKLWAFGFDVKQQYPESTYNIDIAIPSLKIAVEIVSSNWKPFQAEFHNTRTKHLLENGWLVIYVFSWSKEAGLLRQKDSKNKLFLGAVRVLSQFAPERIAEYVKSLEIRINNGENLNGKYIVISGNGIVLSAAYKKAMFFYGLPCLSNSKKDAHGHSFGLIAQSYCKV